MANTRKSIFYPRNEGDISTYYSNAITLLAGTLGIKYGTDAATITGLNGHKAQIPATIKKAYEDSQAAKSSTKAKKMELAEGKKNLLRELNRITRLDSWDEEDGKLLGIRQKTGAEELNNVKPIIKSYSSMPDKVLLNWLKKGMDSVLVEWLDDEIAGGSSQWVKLGEDSFSPYEDKRPNKSNRPENRFYRLRYIKNDKPVGRYSEIMHVVAEIYTAE